MRAQKLAALIFCVIAAAPASSRAENPPPTRSGVASCYGREHQQWRTATGAWYDPRRLTAAHRSLPFGTRVRVTNLHNDRSVTVVINDRGPAARTHRAIDLSLGACRAVGNSGLARVFLQIVGDPHEAHSRLRPRRHVRHRHRA